MKQIAKWKNKITMFLLAICVLTSWNIKNVYAQNDTVNDTYKYFESFYSGENNVLVTDEEGNDVTNEFIKYTRELFKNNELEKIKHIMAENKLLAHILMEEEIATPYALEQYKAVYDIVTGYYKDSSYGTVMEFRGRLSGGIWYNPNTYEVTRVSSPVFTPEVMNVPMGIRPSCNDYNTSSWVSGGKGYFKVNYTLTGVYNEDPSAPPIYYNYGSHTFTFSATP